MIDTHSSSLRGATTSAVIRLAESNADIAACYPVLRELRPHLSASSFVARVQELQEFGYALASLREADSVVAVAGFRLSANLAWGRFLYVDDLVTLDAHRSRGAGAALLSWLARYAADRGCEQLHLDSGVQRGDAHRFYRREGLQVTSYHFACPLTNTKPDDAASPDWPVTLR